MRPRRITCPSDLNRDRTTIWNWDSEQPMHLQSCRTSSDVVFTVVAGCDRLAWTHRWVFLRWHKRTDKIIDTSRSIYTTVRVRNAMRSRDSWSSHIRWTFDAGLPFVICHRYSRMVHTGCAWRAHTCSCLNVLAKMPWICNRLTHQFNFICSRLLVSNLYENREPTL